MEFDKDFGFGRLSGLEQRILGEESSVFEASEIPRILASAESLLMRGMHHPSMMENKTRVTLQGAKRRYEIARDVTNSLRLLYAEQVIDSLPETDTN